MREKNKSLKNLTTFGVECLAESYIAVNQTDELVERLQSGEIDTEHLLILGGGSNLLFTRNFDGLVLHMCNKGIEVESEDDDFVFVRVQAGEEWDDFVGYCLDRNLGGVENLIAIPGRVGASPVQNIGAYGAEVKDVITEVELAFLSNGRRCVLTAHDCNFGYRSSIFKNELKGKVVITSVVFRLRKHPEIQAGYGDVQKQLNNEGITSPTIRDVARIIRSIRDAKLPDPKVTGNAGSFFKNPVIDEGVADKLKAAHPEMPFYLQAGGQVKLAAGWLIEQCGLKGFKMGHAAVHDRQALVLVNLGEATGQEVVSLANWIINRVEEQFGVRLEPEVNIL
jgi:UDP-N-acetylmuramate dehydrogenase